MNRSRFQSVICVIAAVAAVLSFAPCADAQAQDTTGSETSNQELAKKIVNPLTDINRDGTVNLLDLAIVAMNYNKTSAVYKSWKP